MSDRTRAGIAIATKSTVSLAPGPLPLGQMGTPVRVYFFASASSADAPDTFDPGDPQWVVRHSDADFRVTSAVLNHLDEARVAGTNLRRFLLLNDLSMWQFLPASLWNPLYQAVELTRLVKGIVRDAHPAQLRLFAARDSQASASLWEGVVRSVAGVHGVEVEVVRPARRSLSSWARSPLKAIARRLDARALVLRAQWLLIGIGARWVNRWLRGRPIVGKKVIFVTFERHWVQEPFEPGRRYDEQMYPLLDALRAGGWTQILAIDCPDGPVWKDVRKLWQRLRDSERGVNWIPFYSYASTSRSARRAARAHFAERWKILRQDHTFAEDFAYEGVPLMPALKRELEGVFRVILPSCAEMLAVAKRIISEERPDGLIATYETGPIQRALIIEAARAGVPTLGLMHGVIFDYHHDYAYERITTEPVRDPESFAVPQVTCVWGPFWKDVLTRALHYPPNAVAVTGNWRYDRVLRILRSPIRVDDGRTLGPASRKKIVAIVSGLQSPTDFVRESLNAVADVGDCLPLIKLHPVDDRAPVRALLKELGYASPTLVERPLIEVLSAADLVVSQVSTAVSEAVLLDRPVVLVDLLVQSGHRQYVEAGVCLYVTDRANLADTIRGGLFDSTIRARLASARRDFAQRFFSPLDARSAERVVEALESRVTATVARA